MHLRTRHSLALDDEAAEDERDLATKETPRRGRGRPRRVEIDEDEDEDEEVANDVHVDEEEDSLNSSAPPRKKRRLLDYLGNRENSTRAKSPPWKPVAVDGPTSFVDEDGRRKSSRVNALPRELLPGKGKKGRRREPPTKSLYARGGEERRSTGAKTVPGARQPARIGRPPGRSRGRIGRPPGRPPGRIGRPPGRPPGRIGRPPGRPSNAARVERPSDAPINERRSSLRSPTTTRSTRANGYTDEYSSPRSRRRNSEENTRRSSRAIKYTPNSPLRSRHSAAHDSDEELDDYDQDEELSAEEVDEPLDVNYKIPLLKIKVRAPKQTITHPEHVVRRKYDSFEDWLDSDDAVAEGATRITPQAARKEARLRIRLLRAGQPGGALSEGHCSLFAPEVQEEPPTQYGHWDHLVAHALRFKTLMSTERRQHLATARRIAYAVQARWRELQPKSLEEIEQEKQEEFRQLYKSMLKKDFVNEWKKISDEVDVRRHARWEVEKELMTKEALNAMLEQSKELHARRIRQGSADSESSAFESEEEDNMSSESDEEVDVDDDADLTVDQLREKYASMSAEPSRAMSVATRDESVTEMDVELDGDEVVELDDVDDVLLDDSDASTDMSGDMGSSDESGDEQEDDSDGLLGFFGRSDRIHDVSDVDMEEDQTLVDSEVPEELNGRKVLAPVVNRSNDPSLATSKTSDVESVMSLDDKENSVATTPQTPHVVKTPIPPLLRGKLREYQHEGLDWLAGQFAHGQNGILADEMGLGKTIQSISLLAHLASEHGIWGPHLIVVPTSVMLNWEMEFKKFCPGFKILTYYGTQEERKQKRKGWLNDDLWNVCITSYQLVLQDQQTFKRRNWQYLILDEAHNIKNFRSQRWQTLLNFKTRARLLLTGTPLQNNLSELWSLMYFLMPSEQEETGITQFAGLRDFLHIFRKPVEEILENGRDALGPEAQGVVHNLHSVLRPFLLRRLKADVEKQMPGKYEHVVYCRLSKRQRFLYDGFMARASTRDALRSGNYLSVMSCLIQLRKVCNHPDLFETRPIVTSFAMDRSAVADFEIKELLVRRRLLRKTTPDVNLDFLNLLPAAYEHVSASDAKYAHYLNAIRTLRDLYKLQTSRTDFEREFDGSTLDSTYQSLENQERQFLSRGLAHSVYQNALRIQRRPIYGAGTVDICTLDPPVSIVPPRPVRQRNLLAWMSDSSALVKGLVSTLEQRSTSMRPLIEKFACITPAVVATDMVNIVLPEREQALIRDVQTTYYKDNFHVPRMCLSIAFPDKRLLQYDCGKLQRLDKLLRELQAGGHRALIFTQMTKVLDILEQFLNIHGHRYLRLDGATKIEQRQILTDRFNHDPRILCFILSSRSGGLGINLTGADTVIFYDLDWNPAMDKQCQDRCHRIGQTRDVHIYRFVSEYTIESNILRKANQKQLLDDVIIQEGEFTTDYFNRLSVRDILGDDAVAALEADNDDTMDRTLGQEGPLHTTQEVENALAQVEDKEDTLAAKAAEREVTNLDAADFDDKPTRDPLAIPRDPAERRKGNADTGDYDIQDRGDSVGMYMLRFLEWATKDIPLAPPDENLKKKKKKKRQPDGPGALA